MVFVWIGAATLDELYEKKNLTIFMLFSVYCFGCLGLMGDFGTAIIFFVTFLIISFLRSGDFSKLVLMVGAAAAGGFMILRFKPYVANRSPRGLMSGKRPWWTEQAFSRAGP